MNICIKTVTSECRHIEVGLVIIVKAFLLHSAGQIIWKQQDLWLFPMNVSTRSAPTFCDVSVIQYAMHVI